MSRHTPPKNRKPWLYQGSPAIVAHRGDAQNFPENTLLAIEQAVQAGASFVEFDIQLSRDGIPFLMHDDNLLRTADLDRSVFDLDFTEIAEIPVGEADRFGEKYQTEKPISLRDLCTKLNQWPQVQSFIEIKEESIDQFGLERTLDAILEATASLKAPHMLISFSEDAVNYAKQHSDRLVGWVVTDWGETSHSFIQSAAPDCVFCNYQKIPDAINLSSLYAMNILWVLYEIIDPDIAYSWRERGADLIETMEVQPMLRALSTGDS